MHRCRVTRRRHRRLKQAVHEGQQLACLASSSSSDEEAEVHVAHSDDVETDWKKWFDYSTNAGGFTQLVWTGAGLDISKLAKRRLPPGNTARLYAMYVASNRLGADNVAGYGAFRRRWCEHWSQVLEFSQISDHSMCDKCYEFKMARKSFRRVRSVDLLEEHFAALRSYQLHLNKVFSERNVVWEFFEHAAHQALGIASPGEGFLMVIADGMDQAKWRLPRWPSMTPTHKIGNFRRPTVCVEAVWIVGRRLDFYVLDKDQRHNSNSIIQCIAESMEKLADDFKRKNKPIPPILV